MYTFEYHRPDSLDEVDRLLGSADEPKLLAGGMTLLPTMKQRLAQPSDLVDLAAVDSLRGVSVRDDQLVIGAMTRHVEVATGAEVLAHSPALAALAGLIGDPQVRNRGTIGGSVANADPAADYPAGLLALNARVTTTRREFAADDFFLDLFETALDEDELVLSVTFPSVIRAAYMKFPNPASRYAIVGVMVAEHADHVRVAVTGAGPNAFRVPEMESALAAEFAPHAVAGISISDAGLNEDIHASAEYRAHLVTIMAKRAVAALVD
ncbi:MAG: xanthine dehydrogenase family protein subunit M [Chromatiales bacterium]|jgi:aerobic carbon-monoxide dehydrogenase medium subunit|nr:xanthine dehydrogenase family protein subunit M [Chromatiales bacterium]